MSISEVLENVLLFFLGYFWTSMEIILPFFWNEPVRFFMGLAAAFLMIDFLNNKNLSLVEKELDVVREELAAKDTEAKLIKGSVADTLIREHEEKLAEKEESIQRKDEEVKKKQQEMGTKIDTLTHEYEKKLEEKEECIQRKDEEVKKKQQEMGTKIDNLSLVKQELDVVKKELAAKNLKVMSMKGYIDTLTCDYEEMLKEQEKSIQRMDKEIKKKQQEIEDLTARLETEKEIREILRQLIGKCKDDIKQLRWERATLVQTVNAFTGRLQEMKTKKFRCSMADLIRHKFETKVIPSTLICALKHYNPGILSTKDIEKVHAEEKQEGSSTAAASLLNLLCRYGRWFPCLMKALRDPMVKQADMADYAESALDHVQDETRQEYLKLANKSQGEHQMEFGFQSDIDTKKGILSCENEASHDTFTTLDTFHLELLPKNWKYEVMGDLIKAAELLTVKVESKYISDRRPQGYPLHDLGGLCGLLRVGCGMVWTLKREFSTEETSNCPCCGCLRDEGKRKKRGEFIIFTDRHLIYDDDEAYFTTITVSYDNGDGNVKTEQLFPVSCDASKGDEDYIEITCVTHDEQVAGKLEKALDQYAKRRNEIERKTSKSFRNQETSESRKCIIIFFSHGLKKCITVGDVTDSNPLHYQALTCPGSSGAPVFVLGDCFERGKYVSTTTHCTYNMTSGIGKSCTWRR